MKRLLLYFFLIIFLVLDSCDIIEDDSAAPTPDINLEAFASPNQSSVIDLQRVFTDYESAQLESTNRVSLVENRFIRYQSNEVDGDKFSFNIERNGRKSKVNVTMKSFGEGDCSDNEPFTYAQISNKTPLVVNLFNNPEFCGYDIFSLGELGIAPSRDGIDEDQNSENVMIELCACGNLGDHAILTYVPPTGFVGQVKFKYYLHAGVSESDRNKYGEAVYYDPKYADYFSAHSVVIDVTE